MSFDEQLRRLFDTTIAELTESARADAERARQEGTEEGRKQGLEEGRQLGVEEGRQLGVEEGRQLGVEEGRKRGVEEGLAIGREEAAAHPADTAELDRVLDGLRAIDRARSLSETLDTVAACAARETSRAAVLLVREGRLRGWRFIGFDDRHDSDSFETALNDAGVIAEAIGSGSAASHADVPAFAQPASGASFALPLEVAGSAVAVLYADGFDDSASSGRPGGVVQRLEALGRHASRTLEALTALNAARALSQPAGARQSSGDDEDADASAKRYAKLLVSEIKLYHEPAVAAGRRDRDLVTRLGGEIARARVLYEERVPQSVRARTDYFRDELVKTLANGDAALLAVENVEH